MILPVTPRLISWIFTNTSKQSPNGTTVAVTTEMVTMALWRLLLVEWHHSLLSIVEMHHLSVIQFWLAMAATSRLVHTFITHVWRLSVL